MPIKLMKTESGNNETAYYGGIQAFLRRNTRSDSESYRQRQCYNADNYAGKRVEELTSSFPTKAPREAGNSP